MKMKKRLLSLLLAAAIALPAIPLTANAAGIQSGQPALTVNQSKVAFAGHEWWVIGYNGDGVYSKENDGHITLLAANLDDDFQNVPFRSGQDSAADGYTKYTDVDGLEHYYANNPGGMEAWTTPNEYAGSTLQQKMESIANGFSKKEQAVISARDLASGATENNNWLYGKTDYIDGMAGQGVANQKLWALSEDEWSAIGNIEVLKYGTWWWLRSPSLDYYSYGAWQGHPLGDSIVDYGALVELDAARPAFSLNLSSVLFTSAADESGKSSATAGGGLIDISSPAGTVKFTMLDESQTLKLGKKATQTGTTFSFSYSGATTGDNQYISCILTDDSGAVKYYGKLTDSSSAASGNLSVPLAGVADGIYTLKIFSEQANGDLYTDFCSEPVTMKVDVSGKDVTVSGFDGEIHKHNWNENAWNSNNTHHWHECTAEDCPVTDNREKDGYAEHTYDQTVAANEYLKSAANCDSPAVYYQSCVCGAFSETADTFTKGIAAGHKISHVEAKTPTANESGNIEYWYCGECGKYFSDEALTKEIKQADTILAATGTTDPDKETDIPQTGDSSHPLVWILLAFVSGGAVLTLSIRNRKKKESAK